MNRQKVAKQAFDLCFWKEVEEVVNNKGKTLKKCPTREKYSNTRGVSPPPIPRFQEPDGRLSGGASCKNRTRQDKKKIRLTV